MQQEPLFHFDPNRGADTLSIVRGNPADADRIHRELPGLYNARLIASLIR